LFYAVFTNEDLTHQPAYVDPSHMCSILTWSFTKMVYNSYLQYSNYVLKLCVLVRKSHQRSILILWGATIIFTNVQWIQNVQLWSAPCLNICHRYGTYICYHWSFCRKDTKSRCLIATITRIIVFAMLKDLQFFTLMQISRLLFSIVL